MLGFGKKRGGLARSAAADLYIELLKSSVGNTIYDDDVDQPARGRVATQGAAADDSLKFLGHIWPSRAHTMIGVPRLDNLRSCVEKVLDDGVEGDFIETGVWRGGACILMRGILKAYGVEDRLVWVADSFAGLPRGDPAKYPKESPGQFHDYADLAVSLEQVQRNFARYNLLDGQVKFLKGWFRDTLPGAPLGKLALIRLDGDLYESTMDALVALYPKLSLGGYVLVDDYNNVPSCTAAVDDFRRAHDIRDDLSLLPRSGAFWQRRS